MVKRKSGAHGPPFETHQDLRDTDICPTEILCGRYRAMGSAMVAMDAWDDAEK
jgi:hypothetical protein